MGYVTGTTNTGGLAGSGAGTVTHAYWDTEMTGQDTSSGGVGKETSEMMTENTYEGWNFDEEDGTWVMDEGGSYAHFQFRYPEGVRGIWGKVLDESGVTPLGGGMQVGLYVSDSETADPSIPLDTTKTGASSMYYFVVGNDDIRIQPTDYVIGGLMDPAYSGNTRMLAETGSIPDLDIWGHLSRVIPHPHPVVPDVDIRIPPPEMALLEIDRSLQGLMNTGELLGSQLSAQSETPDVEIIEEHPVMVLLNSQIDKREEEIREEAGISFNAAPQPGQEPVSPSQNFIPVH
jgi:hypothetical protein